MSDTNPTEETAPAPTTEEKVEETSTPAPEDKPVEEKPAENVETAEPAAEETKEEPAESAASSEPAAAASEEPARDKDEANKAAEDDAGEEPKTEEVAEPEPESIEIPKGNGELVLVTGATGYLASHIVKTLVDSGEYKVRGSVRSLEDNERLEKLKSLVESATYPVEFVEADLTKPETWEEAVKGCDYVIHTASPFPVTEPSNPSEIINPAKDGTLAILKACSESGTVRRVVVTSSCAAVYSGRAVDKAALTEENWGDVDKCVSAYDKSKIIAEKAAWDFIKELPEGNNLELSVVNPGLITGPPLMKMDSTSIEVIKKIMNREFAMVPKISFPMCDIRDVALAHVRAMVIKQAAGNRHIVCSTTCWMKDMANFLSQEFSSKGFKIPTTQAPYVLVWIKSHFDEALKRIMHDIGKHYVFDNQRMKRILQIEPREVKDSLVEMGHAMINLGIVQKIEKAEKKPRKLTFRKKKEQEEGEEKKDEPEKIKEGSASGSPENGSVEEAKIDDVKVEVAEATGETVAEVEPVKVEEAKTEEVKAEQSVAAEAEKPAEEGAVVSSEEEIKEETPDPESAKKDKKKKEKPKKEKKKGLPSFLSFKKNKKPQVEKKAADEEESAPAAEAEAPAAAAATEVEAAPADEKPAEGKTEEPAAEDKPAEDKPAEDQPAEDKPAEDKPAEDKPAEDKPAEDKPAEEAAPAKEGEETKDSPVAAPVETPEKTDDIEVTGEKKAEDEKTEASS